ncbi:hypothetical protein PV325_001432 [Microctonus aethiopoides]|nr:hypothetical protein PV325_001432 [Microctonus aethiopoides]KAK0085416.1 hypothetical protein PV326_005928 [Microctonus aethiopoides]
MSNEIRALYSTLMRFIEDSRFLDITCKLKLHDSTTSAARLPLNVALAQAQEKWSEVENDPCDVVERGG